MRIEILQKNYIMGEKLKEIITKKTEKLSKYFEEDTPVKIVLKKESDIYKMEFTTKLNSNYVRSEVEGENMYENIDIILPKIERQLLKHKTKLQKRLKQSAFDANNDLLFTDNAASYIKPNVVRVKKFTVDRMNVDDAIEEMDMIGHAFYIYADEITGNINVVYRRDDGTVGLLEPTTL